MELFLYGTNEGSKSFFISHLCPTRTLTCYRLSAKFWGYFARVPQNLLLSTKGLGFFEVFEKDSILSFQSLLLNLVVLAF